MAAPLTVEFTDEQRALVRKSWAAALDGRKAHVAALQESWKTVKIPDDVPAMDTGAVDSFAELFYATLFDRVPELREIIISTVTAGKRLMPIIHTSVAHTANKTGAAELGAMLSGLVEEHKEYGVKEEHYKVFGDALIDAVGTAVGAEAFTDDVRGAWAAFSARAIHEALKAGGDEPALSDDQRALVRKSWEQALEARKEHVQRLRDSWKGVSMPDDVPPLDPDATDSLADVFYGTLFERVPELKGIIKSVTTAGKRLLPMVHAAVAHTERRTGAEELGHLLRALVAEHAEYGVKEEHYQVFADCLCDTVGRSAGDACSADCTEAWKAFTSRAREVALQQAPAAA